MSLRSKVPGETGEMEEPEAPPVQILLTSMEDSVSMRSLGVSSSFILVLIFSAKVSVGSSTFHAHICT